MNITRNKRVGIIWIIIIIFGLGAINKTKPILANQEEISSNLVINDLIDVPEIVITNDADVAYWANGGGDGSSGNPYILQNYNILGTGPFGILIDASGTGMPYNVSFTIRNCIVTAIEVCIKVVDAYPNLVRIESCYCYGTIAGDGIGIHLLRCDGAVIWNCTCNYNLHTGIRIDTSVGTLTQDSTCFGNGDEGIYLDNASDGAVVENNDFILSNFGIYNEISHSNHFLYNTVANNSWEGILITNSQNVIIQNNTIATNGLGMLASGIFYINSDYGQVLYNNIIGNSLYGLEIDMISDGLIIHHNNFINNQVATSQAQEDSSLTKINATWYDIGLLEGNYWNDYVGPGYYYIDGTASNFDPYPLSSPVNIYVIAEYSSLLIGFLLAFSLIGTAVIFLKKR